MQTGNTNYIYKIDLDEACFQQDMAYGKYKDLTKGTESDTVLRDKAFKIAGNSKYDGYQRGLVSIVYKFLIKNQKSVILNLSQINNLQMNVITQLLEKFKRRRVCSSFKYNTWIFDLADMQLTSKYNKGIRFLLCVIYLFSKYEWVVLSKNKNVLLFLMDFKVL